MGMLVTLYLILINTYTSIDAPSKRGFSNVDLWFACCQVPVAFAISVRPKPVTDTETDTESQNSPNPTPIPKPNPKK